MKSVANLPQESKVLDASSNNGVKVADLQPGDKVKIDGREYRIVADGRKGKQLWFVQEGSS